MLCVSNLELAKKSKQQQLFPFSDEDKKLEDDFIQEKKELRKRKRKKEKEEQVTLLKKVTCSNFVSVFL
tara:strand:+ start:416 stop:622 length:207 start_codon:yes stop_codon:yes gene_type:complete